MKLLAAYIAKSGRIYTGDMHTDCLYEAQAAGEPEARGFPYDSWFETGEGIADCEERMGFMDNGVFLTRTQTEDRYGFSLAEEQEG